MQERHSTRDYHVNDSPDLMTELTICESLASDESPYMIALENPRSYGAMIGDFLVKMDVLKPGSRIMEAGGGYGTLMKGLLSVHANLIASVCMTDLSPYMLKRQREALHGWKQASFVQRDVLTLSETVSDIDLLIINEVIGDLDVITGLDSNDLPDEVLGLVKKYNLELPSAGSFNFNIGAIKLVEALSKKKFAIFISEHSSDPIIPAGMEYLKEGLALNTYPREIPLHKHSEYTIRFSHLVNIAKAFGRKVSTGPLIDLVGIKNTNEMRFVFTSRACSTERQELIYELLDHIREYRWLLIE